MLPSKKLRQLILFILVAAGNLTSYSQAVFSLYAPADKAVTPNNMPVFSWQKTECSHYEVWIDGIMMEKISSDRNSCVPFPLSFGRHSWHVMAVNGTNRIRSNVHELTIDDAPLAMVAEGSVLLRHNWQVISSLKAGTDGSALTKEKINTEGWANTSVPATVLTALVRNGIYPNPYMGMNNMRIPDASDEYNSDYDLLKFSHIPGTNPWKNPYWFRNEFTVPAGFKGKMIWLNFGEINYKAEVWLNGKRISDTSGMIGMERIFRFDITRFVNTGNLNTMAVAIYPPNYPGKPAPEPLTPFADPGQNMADGAIARDYTKWDVLGWDWQPAVRDRDMGITEDVFLTATDAIELMDLYVTSDLKLPDTALADITVTATLVNHSAQALKTNLKGSVSIGNRTISFSLPCSLAANESKEIFLDKNNVPELSLANPKLWWPAGYGKQNLYTLSLVAETGDGHKTNISSRFGIRKLETYIGAREREFKINGRKIYLRGGNWVIDMMLNWNAERYEEEILLTRNANLNILRVWGPTGVAPKALYEAADKYGILLWQDFLNDFWGTFKNTPGYQPEISLFEKATTGIVKKYRNHPSLILWCGGNEGPNPRESLIVNEILAKYDARGNRHYLTQSDGDGLHGGGPYHTLEPKDYFTHPKLMGFSSEIGPSGIPELQSLLKFMPEPAKTRQPGRFPIDGVWAYHDANDWPGTDTRKFTSYDNMVRKYYGSPDTTGMKGFEEYSAKTQVVNYDVYRASIESINRQLWSNASGILLWKSNSSWPSATWQVYDWFLQAHAGYYGTKKAGEAIHVQLNRDNLSVTFVNMTANALENISIHASLLNTKMETTWSKKTEVKVPADAVTETGIIVPETDEMQFLKLVAMDKNGKVLSENLYWVSRKNNYLALNSLPAPEIETRIKSVSGSNGIEYEITIKNTGNVIAFMLSLRIAGKDSHQEILPSYWSDNYFSLLPGEERTVYVKPAGSGMLEKPVLEFRAFNMPGYRSTDL
ncbi:MAG: glycoside hydrolase family 2 protein [Lentimicrobium sp.]